MKKTFLAGMLLSALLMQSCDDKDFVNGGGGEPQVPGTDVDFSAGLGSVASRTEYGDEEGGVFPIYWNCPDPTDEDDNTDYDHIFISSPDAPTGSPKHGHYKVIPADKKSPASAAVVKASETDEGVKVGSGSTQRFYAFYPYSYVNQAKLSDQGYDHTYVYATMPTSQKVMVPKTPKNNVYEAVHDMNLCFMTADHSPYDLTKGGPVQLQFHPWATVLDITIPGPENAGESCVITSVLVRSRTADGSNEDAPNIVGTFKCDLSRKSVEFETIGTNTKDEPDHVLNIDLYPEDADEKTLPGVTLAHGESIRLKAFLVPTDKAVNVNIEVFANNDKMWSKSLEHPKPNSADPLLAPGKIHKIGLPNLTLPGRTEYSSWITDLSDNMRVTEMSIPGSIESFSYKLPDGDPDKIQECDITEQFNAGIRAFRARVILADGVDETLKQPWSKHLQVTMNGTSGIMELGKAIHELHQEMQSRGNREFCVLMLSFESTDVTKKPDYYATLKNYADYMYRLGITPTTVDRQGLTLGSLRGRILLQAFVDASRPDDMVEYWGGNMNTAPLCPYYNIERYISLKPTSGYTVYNNNNKVVSKATDIYYGPGSWSNLHGAPMLITWDLPFYIERAHLTPVVFGNIGTYRYTTAAASDYADYTVANRDPFDGALDAKFPYAPATDNTDDPGLAWLCARIVYDNAMKANVSSTAAQYANLYKSNVFFEPNYLQNHTESEQQRYKSWLPNDLNDSRFLWWMRSDIKWGDTDKGTLMYAKIQQMWNPSPLVDVKVPAGTGTNPGATISVPGGEAYRYFEETGGRIFITTDLASNATSFSFSGASINFTSRDQTNYGMIANFLGLVHPTQNNVGAYGDIVLRDHLNGGAYIKEMDGMPLGVVFLGAVPRREKEISTQCKGSYYQGLQWYTRTAIELIIRRCRSMSPAQS